MKFQVTRSTLIREIPAPMERKRMMTAMRIICVSVVVLASGCGQKAGLGNYARGMDLFSRGEYEKAV